MLTIPFGLKEDLVCFPLAQALHRYLLSSFVFGSPLTMSLDISLLIVVVLMCPTLLCHKRELGVMALRHVSKFLGLAI